VGQPQPLPPLRDTDARLGGEESFQRAATRAGAGGQPIQRRRRPRVGRERVGEGGGPRIAGSGQCDGCLRRDREEIADHVDDPAVRGLVAD
jgi:hypothetical protein